MEHNHSPAHVLPSSATVTQKSLEFLFYVRIVAWQQITEQIVTVAYRAWDSVEKVQFFLL